MPARSDCATPCRIARHTQVLFRFGFSLEVSGDPVREEQRLAWADVRTGANSQDDPCCELEDGSCSSNLSESLTHSTKLARGAHIPEKNRERGGEGERTGPGRRTSPPAAAVELFRDERGHIRVFTQTDLATLPCS